MYVRIGGIDQWIQSDGGSPNQPVLLYLHGGPGGTSVPVAVEDIANAVAFLASAKAQYITGSALTADGWAIA